MFNMNEKGAINTAVLKEFEAKGVKIFKFAQAAYLLGVNDQTRKDIQNRICAVRQAIRDQMNNDKEYENERKNIQERYELELEELEKEWKTKHFKEALHNATKEA